jgi:predicted ATP-binding protein involved in virulence
MGSSYAHKLIPLENNLFVLSESILANVGEGAFSKIQLVGSTHLPSTIRTDETSKVRFCATLGEEPEVEMTLE